ncbi:hypothetical protein NDU88_002760 [Pleurodeles waltl]|uniref:Uncharacterized protein n=1 Tax=Pleurodeles waltl TaxID=8319 RepID=A0AAV7RDP3_PLEWA|nr:hypothetical protein NDU88_002760 [Pleurodeles waltl]
MRRQNTSLNLISSSNPKRQLGTNNQKAEIITTSEDDPISLKDIMAAIQGAPGALESKINSVVTEVALKTADFQNLGARVKEAEGSLKEIKDDSATLKAQVLELKATTASLEAEVEELKGHSHSNNTRITGVPKKTEGPAVNFFVEDLTLKHL